MLARENVAKLLIKPMKGSVRIGSSHQDNSQVLNSLSGEGTDSTSFQIRPNVSISLKEN